jgi:hypothetical protein
MSTHCGIAIKTEKGYEVIYCHHDGYPEYMWPMPTENYNSEELASKLVALGDASYIEKKLEPTYIDSETFHSFGTPEPNVCMFYHRDRGEPWEDVAPDVHQTVKEALSQFYYGYLWENDCWHYVINGEEIYI